MLADGARPLAAALHGAARATRVARVALVALSGSLLLACAQPGALRAAGPPIVAAADWGAEPLATPPEHQRVTHLTVHHQGETWVAGRDVAHYLKRLQRWSRQTKGWADLPYHYIVAPDGQVYAGRNPALPGDTNTDYDPRGHLQIMLLGNFEHQVPTPSQWASTVALLAHLLQRHGLPPDSIGAHRHHAGQTVCPGAHLFARFDALRDAAAQQALQR